MRRMPVTSLLALVLWTGAITLPAPAQEAAPRPRLPRYEHELVLPFSFDYPEDWEVWESPPWASRHWLVAFPRAAGTKPREAPAGALRVTVRGHVPELFLAANRPQRAAALFRATLAARPGGADAAIQELDPVDLGGATGSLFVHRARPDAGVPDGAALVAARGCGLLLAEITWPKQEEPARLDAALRLLRSFRMPERAPTGTFRWPEEGEALVSFEYPSDWPVTPVRADDGSSAFQIEMPSGRELVLRSLVLPEGKVVDDATCRRVARGLLADRMRLVSASEIATAASLALPGSPGGILLLRRLGDTAQDVYVFVRGGALHVAFLDVAEGLATEEFGRALEIITSLRGPREVPADGPRLDAEGRATQSLVFESGSLDVFTLEGVPRRAPSPRLRLLPDGRFLLDAPAFGIAAPAQGTYRFVEGGLDLIQGEQRKRLETNPGIRALRDPLGQEVLFRVPDVP
ncbi:MAG: hypothetical protein R3F20_07590 [Planctomycetota bacterium]